MSPLRQRGQAVVELALILPVLLLLTLGIIDFSRVFAVYVPLINGTQAAAIYASSGNYLAWCAADGVIACPAGSAQRQRADPNNIAYQISRDMQGADTSRIVMAQPLCTKVGMPDMAPCDPSSSGLVRITVSYDVPLLTPVVSSLFGGYVHLTAATTAAIL